MHFVNRVLEYFWNKTVSLSEPINYFLCVNGEKKIVVRDILVKDEMKKLIFISQQLAYIRKGKFWGKKVRQYKIEVVETSAEQHDGLPSRIFMVPELCSVIFKDTLIPHSCAINFVISKIQNES